MPPVDQPAYLDDLPLARAALDLASEAHSGQQRWDGAPFVLHPLEVGSLLRNTGHADSLVAAGILHDVLEHSGFTAADLERAVGPGVASAVVAVTEDPGIDDYAARKGELAARATSSGDDALGLFAADKVAKVRELRAQMTHAPDLAATEDGRARLRHHRHCELLLRARAPDHPLVRQLRFELWALDRLPPRT